MTTTMTLAEWLEVQLAADEAVARAASNPPWIALTMFPTRSEVTNETEIDGGVIVKTPTKDDADVTHIATHDPAHVLDQIAAVREVLAIHDPTRPEYHPMDIWAPPMYERPIICGPCQQQWPCDTVRALAKGYAGRDGYEEVAG